MAATRLVVLARPPLPGRCKTRLAADLGAGAAARLARAMLRDTWSSVSALAARHADLEVVLATCAPPEHYPLLRPAPATMPQGEGDLGRRMARLMAEGLATAERVLLLGTDAPGWPAQHIEVALAALDHADLVLGEVPDGGFWCLGGRSGAAPLRDATWLDDLDWDRDGTAAPLRRRAAGLGLTCAEAPAWFDLDHAADLPRLQTVLAADPRRAPAMAADLSRLGGEDEPALISIIVPSLDEGPELAACLDALRDQPGPLELVVADGGSADGSAEAAAKSLDVTVVASPPGRGRQLAAGAALATGSGLLFLHADARLPEGGADLVRAALGLGAPPARPPPEAGAFVIRTEADPALPDRAGPLLRLADLRSRLTRHPYGDQALFVTRAAYDAVGGFRDLPIMEDYDLAVRLAARAPLARIRRPVRVSGRGIQTRPLRAFLLMRLIPPLFRLGVDPGRLARLYRGR